MVEEELKVSRAADQLHLALLVQEELAGTLPHHQEILECLSLHILEVMVELELLLEVVVDRAGSLHLEPVGQAVAVVVAVLVPVE